MEERIKELEIELRIKEEQLNDARKALKGTIEAEGKYVVETKVDGSQSYSWSINTSDILTKLIQEAGRLCDRYASDLFIDWEEINKGLEHGSIKKGTYVFAIRDDGIDHKTWYEKHKNDYNYYRAVWFLDVIIVGKTIKMILHK